MRGIYPAQGRLDDDLPTARKGSFSDVGVVYVRFALAHPGHFTVMLRPDLLDNAHQILAGIGLNAAGAS